MSEQFAYPQPAGDIIYSPLDLARQRVRQKSNEATVLRAERDDLRAEVERLRTDNERLRGLLTADETREKIARALHEEWHPDLPWEEAIDDNDDYLRAEVDAVVRVLTGEVGDRGGV